jgi:hypothetical protein
MKEFTDFFSMLEVMVNANANFFIKMDVRKGEKLLFFFDGDFRNIKKIQTSICGDMRRLHIIKECSVPIKDSEFFMLVHDDVIAQKKAPMKGLLKFLKD